MRIIGISLTLAACLLLVRPVVAGDGCGAANRCAHCGCGAACQQVSCQIVAGVAKVKKHSWIVKEEPVCPLKPGCIPCLHDTFGGLFAGHEAACTACGEAGCGGTCEKAKCLVPPQCGKVRTKKVLVKKEYEVEVPVYKCVAKFLCGECGVDPAVIGPKPGPGPAPGPAPVPVPPVPTPGSMQGVPIPPPPAPLPHQRASAEVAPLPAIN